LVCHPVLDGVAEPFHRQFDGAPAQFSQVDAPTGVAYMPPRFADKKC